MAQQPPSTEPEMDDEERSALTAAGFYGVAHELADDVSLEDETSDTLEMIASLHEEVSRELYDKVQALLNDHTKYPGGVTVAGYIATLGFVIAGIIHDANQEAGVPTRMAEYLHQYIVVSMGMMDNNAQAATEQDEDNG